MGWTWVKSRGVLFSEARHGGVNNGMWFRREQKNREELSTGMSSLGHDRLGLELQHMEG